ncbi:MAG TPA: NAD(P)-dependent oxidoreductase [Pseudolabrys sp.]|nr:NAD(P)-dependent oxidoreductase [Pseudolabrys sp.]
MSAIKTIAFAGLGNMGAPMAAQLAAKGFALSLYDRRAEAARGFAAAHGGRAAFSVAEAARGADAAICMLPDDAAVREVVLGEGGLATAMAAGAVVIDMGTSDPRSTVAIGGELAERGIGYVDAPVMGGVVFAKDASLDVMAGGREEDVARCMPIFSAVGRHVFRCGALGSGHALKALANYVNAAALVTLIEALAVGCKFGLDSAIMAKALTHMCTGRQHPLEKKVIPQVLTRKFATGMALGLIAKDVAIAADLGQDIGAVAPLAERVRDIWKAAESKLGPKADQTEVARLWEEGNAILL